MADSTVTYSWKTSGFSLLTFVLITLKLLGLLSLSWWWVLAPVWVPVAIVLVIVAIVFVMFLVDEFI